MCQQRAQRLRFDVLTLFPEVFEPVLKCSILGLAAAKGLVEFHLHDIRDYSEDKHRKVDDRPYGGGPGMVIQCEPVFRACEAVRDMAPEPGRLILLTPQGRRLDDAAAREYARADRLLLLCGHYEG
ncbi:MAG: tRNA (guanosine(37)-N1)-methyltransferase TrmD, partial [Candidatus Brocadiia bacterium]|nr:tRNA (guanosine(37)-N1)-methyltransferase TrmD [Candidatus Brocadiia bacterium]